MKSYKYLCLALMTLAVVSCSDDNFEPGKPSLPTGEKVFVSSDNDTKFTISLEEDEIGITLKRQDATEEAMIPVKLASSIPGIFSGEESVTFAAGESEATYIVHVSKDMLPFKEYMFEIIIPEEFTNAYLKDAPSPRLTCSVTKEDYAVIASGIFTDNVYKEDSWLQDLEYSPMLDLYRLPDVYARGTSLYFHFAQYPDGTSEFYFTDSDGNRILPDNNNAITMNTGIVHSKYGMVVLSVMEEYGIGYDEEDVPEGFVGEFYFVGAFDVAAGRFGIGWQTFDITEWIEKPWLKE